MSIPLNRSRPQAEGSASTSIQSSDASPCETTVDSLTDDLLVEILSRLPARSICRFKCVSKHWLSVIYDRNHRKKLPQTLEGFFYRKKSLPESRVRFTSISGSRRPQLGFTFLPNNRHIDLSDCCNGLLLCRWYGVSDSDDQFRYVVCNPATEKWHELPDSGQSGKVSTARLGFDPTVSSHFHVFVLLEDDDDYHVLTGVHVYSSETGRWIYKEKGWNEDFSLRNCGSPVVFLNSYLHFCFLDYNRFGDCVAAVHTEGETWLSFDAPDPVEFGAVQQSQGRLHYVGFGMDANEVFNQILVYVLEDYDSKRWVLKHSVDFLYLGWITVHICEWIVIHPDCNLIFFTRGRGTTLMCYNMDRRPAKVVCDDIGDGRPPYLPYVPLHAELQSLNM